MRRGTTFRTKILLTSVLVALGLGVVGCYGPSHRIPIGSTQAIEAERQKQLKLTLETQMKKYDRLQSVAFPILTGSTGRCGVQYKYTYGVNLHDRSDYGEAFAPVLGSLGIGDQVTVRYVHPASPAAAAGLQVGDRLLAIEDKSIEGKNADEARALMAESVKQSDLTISFFKPPPPVPVRVLRQGQEHELSLQAVKACDFGVVLAFFDAVNALADGENIVVTTGMMRFAQKDEELAVVVGHRPNSTAGTRKRNTGDDPQCCVYLGAVAGRTVTRALL